MSAPVRFLALLVVGWMGVRAATLGYVPGITVGYAKPIDPGLTELSAAARSEAPAFQPGEEAFIYEWAEPQPIASPEPRPPARSVSHRYAPYAYAHYPYLLPAAAPAMPIPPRAEWQLPSSQAQGPDFYTPIAPIDDWEVSEIASGGFPERQASQVPPVLTQSPAQPRLDRVQMTSWAMLRGAPLPGSLATGGTLGGSQAGARLTYAFNRWLAASLRTTSPVGGSRGAEIAGGLRFTPFRSIPIAITAERRQAISSHGGGRSDFALFAEGGLYRQPMPLQFRLDAYVQAGVVGLKARDYFADGALAFSRPVFGRFSAGFGVWGGVQPGLYRVDAGPRLSFRVRDNIHAHLDWRQRLAGNAEPASGPALTLAADF